MIAQFESMQGWEATRQTLHHYSNIPSVIAQAHLPHHPNWWHISLKVEEDGLASSPVPLPDGGILRVLMNFAHHEMQVIPSDGDTVAFDMRAGLPSGALGAQVLQAVRGFGLDAAYKTKKYEDSSAREYDPVAARCWFDNLSLIHRIFSAHATALPGDTSQAQLWPHHFDISVEWFGARTIPIKGRGTPARAQLNLGWSPGDEGHPEPYFFSNPWPFEDDHLLDQPLPHGARWITDEWHGSILPFDLLINDPNGPEKVAEYAQAVFAASRDSLMENR